MNAINSTFINHRLHNMTGVLHVIFTGADVKPGLFNLWSLQHLQDDFIFVNCPNSTWYLGGIPEIKGGFDGLLSHLNEVAQKYSSVIYHGGSMGAFGAVIFGSLSENKNASILAYSPHVTGIHATTLLSRGATKLEGGVELLIEITGRALAAAQKLGISKNAVIGLNAAEDMLQAVTLQEHGFNIFGLPGAYHSTLGCIAHRLEDDMCQILVEQAPPRAYYRMDTLREFVNRHSLMRASAYRQWETDILKNIVQPLMTAFSINDNVIESPEVGMNLSYMQEAIRIGLESPHEASVNLSLDAIKYLLQFPHLLAVVPASLLPPPGKIPIESRSEALQKKYSAIRGEIQKLLTSDEFKMELLHFWSHICIPNDRFGTLIFKQLGLEDLINYTFQRYRPS